MKQSQEHSKQMRVLFSICALGLTGGFVLAQALVPDKKVDAPVAVVVEEPARLRIPDGEMDHASDLVNVERDVADMKEIVVALNANVEFYTDELAKMNAALQRIETCRVHLRAVTVTE
jgi:hypothetical protein